MTQGSRAGGGRRSSVWLEERPAPRRRVVGSVAQPDGLDRERITATAVRILDADGLARFSMRRLAAELGVTAMSVYWYVDSKDDLLELALDAAQGELGDTEGSIPDGPDGPDEWRARLRAVAHELRALLRRHPWVPALLVRCLNVGPRAVAHATGVRALLVRAGVPDRQVDGARSALFSFVYGHAAVETGWDGRCREAGVSPEECRRALRVRMRERPEYGTGTYGTGTHGPDAYEADVQRADVYRADVHGLGAYRESADERSVPVVGQRDGQDVRERDFGVALDCVIEGLGALAANAARGAGDVREASAAREVSDVSRTAVTPPAPPGCPVRP